MAKPVFTPVTRQMPLKSRMSVLIYQQMFTRVFLLSLHNLQAETEMTIDR